MKKALIIIFSGLSLVALFVFGFYAFFVYSIKAMHKEQTIAENIQVNSDWIEIKSEKPLKAAKQIQRVMISIEGYKHDLGNNDFGNVKLEDGTHVFPEVQIVDENGKIYQLKDSERLGNVIGFSPVEELDGIHQFPKNVSYEVIKIRSNTPFRCKRIYWYNYDLK